MKAVPYKWSTIFHFGKDYHSYDRGWRTLTFGILKIHTEPTPGESLHRGLYKGFLFSAHIWIPIEIQQWR